MNRFPILKHDEDSEFYTIEYEYDSTNIERPRTKIVDVLITIVLIILVGFIVLGVINLFRG